MPRAPASSAFPPFAPCAFPPTRRRGVRGRLALCCGLAWVGPVSAAAPPDLEEVRQAALAFEFSRAAELAGRVSAADPAVARPARLLRGITLLSAQPRTQRNIAEAEQLFLELARERADDEIGLQAAYLAGRVPHLHAFERDLVTADARYTTLIEAHGATLPGQMARLKRALLRLHAASGDAEREATVAATTAELAHVTEPGLAATFHLLLADVLQRFRLDDGAALRHLAAADAIGIPPRMLQADAWVRMVELGLRTGEMATARSAAARFGATFPRDPRLPYLQSLLAEATP